MFTRFGLPAVAAGAAACCALALAPPTQAADGLARSALGDVADREGIATARLDVADRTVAHLRHTDREVVRFKLVAEDGRTFGASYDADSHARVSAAALQRDEAEAQAAARGKQDDSLHARLVAHPHEPATVALWGTMGNIGPALRGPAGRSALRARVQTAQAPLIAAVRAAGGEPAPADLVPVVFADLDAGQVERVEATSAVSTIDLVPTGLQAMTDDSATGNRFQAAWKYATGAGRKVAVHEAGGVDDVNPFLRRLTYWDPAHRGVGAHATHVAGVMASTNAWRRGGAFAASAILSANFHSYLDPQALVASGGWAATNANVVNMSWGGCTGGRTDFFSDWVDYLQLISSANIVIASGNIPNCGGSEHVASPGLARNPLSVGSYFDRDTGLRDDDSLSSFTQWRNPVDPNTGLEYEKPDVLAMGGQANPYTGECWGSESTGVGGGVDRNSCGTSFASPDAAALAANVSQAMARTNAPEAVKAVIMAGATHNISDNAGLFDCPGSPVWADCRDGAGAIDALQSVTIGRTGAFRQVYQTATSFPPAATYDVPVSLTKGKRFRGALTWDAVNSCTIAGQARSCSPSTLTADLDLQLISPTGAMVAVSGGASNNSEVVDYTVPSNGTYKLRVLSYRFDPGSSTHMGLAWNRDTVDAVTPLTGVTPLSLGSTVAGTTDKGTSFWDRYHATTGGANGCDSFLEQETGLEKVYKVTTTATGAITATLSSITGLPGTRSDVDVTLLKAGGPPALQYYETLHCGDTTLTKSKLPAGTYYVVVDGFRGSVGGYRLTTKFTPGGTVSTPAPAPRP